MEKSYSLVKLGRTQAVMKVKMGISDATMNLNSTGVEHPYLQVTVCRYIITEHDCPDQTAYSDFIVWEGRRPGFLVTDSGTKSLSRLVCRASYIYVYYLIAVKNWRSFSA